MTSSKSKTENSFCTQLLRESALLSPEHIVKCSNDSQVKMGLSTPLYCSVVKNRSLVLSWGHWVRYFGKLQQIYNRYITSTAYNRLLIFILLLCLHFIVLVSEESTCFWMWVCVHLYSESSTDNGSFALKKKMSTIYLGKDVYTVGSTILQWVFFIGK